MNTTNTRAAGRTGEELARKHLEKRGFVTICTNYTCRGGEVDIILTKGEYIVFAEVKMRRETQKSRYAAEALDEKKAKRLCHTVRTFMNEYRENPLVSALKPRIDLVEVRVLENRQTEILHSPTNLLELF